MRFLGGFLKFFAILLLLAATILCTAVAIMAENMEAYVVMGIGWGCSLIVALSVLGTGIALSNAHKNKKKIEQLEAKVQGLAVDLARTQAVAAHIATYQAPAAEPATAGEMTAPAPRMPEVHPVTPVTQVPEASQEASAPAPAKNGAGKWIPTIVTACVAVVAIVAVVLVMGNGNNIVGGLPGQTTDPNSGNHQNNTPNDPDDDPTDPADPTDPPVNAISVSVGGVIETEDFTMTIESVEILDEYSYRTSEYSTTSLWVEDGYKLLAVRGVFTNNGTSPISSNSFALSATVNGSYAVSGYDVDLDFERSNSYEVDPYTEQNYILHLNIPAKLAEAFETVTFTIGFNDDMSTPAMIWDENGSHMEETDNLYEITSGVSAGGGNQEPESYPSIAIGDTIDTGDYVFTLVDVEMSYEVLPSRPGNVYSSYPAPSGKVYINVVAKVKNTMQRDIRIEELFTAEALYAGKYPYSGFTVVDDTNRFDWVGSYVAATPLETCIAHSLIECPAEVDESGDSVVVYLELGDTTYEYIMR